MKKLVACLLVVILLFSLAGCGGTPVVPEEPATADVSAAEDDKGGGDKLKVALLLAGPISDQGWNAMAYEGLKKIEKDFGFEIAYSESIPQSDREEQYRGYANQGFDIIFGHGFEFIDSATKVSAEFPDVKFILTSCTVFQEPNLGSVTDDGLAKGFLGGVAAGVLTESNQVSFLGGLEIPPIVAGRDGFEAGAKYVNPDVKVVSTLIGNFEDAGKAKELAFSLSEQGSDILMVQADAAGLGGIEGAQEKGIRVIGTNSDQNSVAPDTIVTSALADYSVAMSLVVQQIIDGSWEPSSSVMGVKEGVTALAPYHGFEDKITAEQKERIESVRQEIINGSLNVEEKVKELVSQ
jgi:basic membrane protein A